MQIILHIKLSRIQQLLDNKQYVKKNPLNSRVSNVVFGKKGENN